MNELIKKLAFELGLDEKLVLTCYKEYWKVIRRIFEGLPLKEDITEEDFDKLKTSVNIQGLGKMYCNYENYSKVRNKYKKFLENAEHKENKTDGQLFGDN